MFTLIALGAIVALIWRQLPSGAYPTDLTRIGQGRPAVVLAHDSNHTGGFAVMELMNAVRGDHDGQVEFLVAHLGLAEGKAFASRHGARDGIVLLFDGQGKRVGALDQPQTTDELRQAMASAFGR
ncbi:hypothetical protein [Ideonella sp. A 288]|uniref:hypothetical protein n=1 Tax=Ideonella sp. A 288 TaxID=1962181 RepID=UPI000B4AF590|nr:hypothetical protein [Ideonella sp. A 288]